MGSGLLQLKYNSEKIEAEFRAVVANLPSDVEVYLVGGSVRNAVMREFQRHNLIQRDYDQVVTKGTLQYEKYLEGLGFSENPYPSHQDIKTVYRKKILPGAIEENYLDWIVFDMHTMDGTDIEHNIKNSVAFTINGCAVKMQDILSQPWKRAIIEGLPGAVQDIKDRRLRLNLDGYKEVASNFYAMLRFISIGFSPPPQDEVQLLLQELPNLEHTRFETEVRKVWDYVGSEPKARDIVTSLGVSIDVFNEDTVKSGVLYSSLRQ
jgi:hypothetical protein